LPQNNHYRGMWYYTTISRDLSIPSDQKVHETPADYPNNFQNRDVSPSSPIF